MKIKWWNEKKPYCPKKRNLRIYFATKNLSGNVFKENIMRSSEL